jgi:hypothetical protein
MDSHTTAVGGLEVLVNLLETDDIKCKIGALHILKDICASPAIKRAIADTGAMTPMVALLAVRGHTRESVCSGAAKSRSNLWLLMLLASRRVHLSWPLSLHTQGC